ncbi:MAG: SH3 domain-containing protein [Clostridiales bacterium]|nr:SH3 domain-containing protein [Clostridiales bacterium]
MRQPRIALALLILLAFLLLCSSSHAQGEAVAETSAADHNIASSSTDEFATTVLSFQQDCPENIRQLLDTHGYRDARVICGGAILLDDPEDLSPDWDMAALVLEAEGQRQFIGLQWLDGTENFALDAYDMQGMDLQRITAVEPVNEGVEIYRRLFGLRLADGGLYQVYAGFGTQWRLYRYVSPAGEAISLLSGELCFDGQKRYVVANNWLKDPRTFAEFPTSYAEAAQWADASWLGVLADGRALVWGANLRQEPTGSSVSLGKYNTALAEILDQQPGKTHPWYQVRIGETVGWISGPYLTTLEDRKRFAVHSGGVDYAVVTRQAVLYRQADNVSVSVELPAGTFMQVLAETGDGWLHVLVTGDRLDLRLEARGAYGYVRADAVERSSKSQD